ncbi:hypothetical protein DL768_010803 [Monosporascus sp. mg162]|nr:hypothetical protein DL768_010803 [Monosporascus sp. mg162]
MTSYLGFLYYQLTYKPPWGSASRRRRRGASLVMRGLRSVSRGEEEKTGRHRGGSGGEPVRVAMSASVPSTTRTEPASWRSPPAPPRATSRESHNRTNHLGTALLSLLLLEPLRRAARQRDGSGDGTRLT